MLCIPLWFEWLRTTGAHNDLQLTIGQHRHVGDSYYFVLDTTLMAGTDIHGALARFLDLWLTQLATRPDLAYVPFDFSDQCTGWLRVATADGTTTVDAGWTLIEGYTFLPSDFASTADGIRELTPAIGTTVTCDRDDLVVTITENRDALNASSESPILAWK